MFILDKFLLVSLTEPYIVILWMKKRLIILNVLANTTVQSYAEPCICRAKLD